MSIRLYVKVLIKSEGKIIAQPILNIKVFFILNLIDFIKLTLFDDLWDNTSCNEKCMS